MTSETSGGGGSATRRTLGAAASAVVSVRSLRLTRAAERNAIRPMRGGQKRA